MRALALCGGHDRSRIKIEQILNERVGMLGFDAEGSQHLQRKVTLIEGHNNASVAANCRSQHVAVIGVGARSTCDKHFVAGH